MEGGPVLMLHVGLDLSRTRLDVHVMDAMGAPVLVTTAAPDAGGLASLVSRVGEFGQPVTAAIESMTGARFVHDQLELRGWEVAIADAVKVKGLAPLAAKTDKIDAWVLAELSRRDLVPAIWLPDPAVRAERERARWRLHLVRHRTALKNRIHATLMAFGHPCPVSDLFDGARCQRTKTRVGQQRGPKVARVDLARRLAEAIWHMLTTNTPLAPAGAATALAA